MTLYICIYIYGPRRPKWLKLCVCVLIRSKPATGVTTRGAPWSDTNLCIGLPVVTFQCGSFLWLHYTTMMNDLSSAKRLRHGDSNVAASALGPISLDDVQDVVGRSSEQQAKTTTSLVSKLLEPPSWIYPV